MLFYKQIRYKFSRDNIQNENNEDDEINVLDLLIVPKIQTDKIASIHILLANRIVYSFDL